MKISKLVSTINDDLFLPSIQREFVWLKNRKDERIEKLFDSIMQRYPIGNIMVWHITKPAGSNLPFTTYKFIENYNEDSRNEEASLNGVKNPLLVLDGQQRLTALLVGLKGSYSFRKNTRNFETRLYINLFGDIEDDQENTYGLKYEFKFLSEKKSNFVEKNESEVKLWLKVGSVLDFENTDAESYKISLREVIESQTDDASLRQRAFTILGRIHAAICDTDINIVEIHDEPGSPEKSIDKVLNIFVRANDGGVKLEKSDLLLSFMESHRDLFEPNGAREEILDFVDELNAVEEAKPNYGFTKDDVLKASLMISGLDIKYKISNFTSENLGKISSNWDKIKVALKTTVDLLAKYKFSPKSIVSKNALFPLSYYIFYYKLNPNFVDSIMASDTNIKENLMNWLLRAMITGHFGRASDAALEKARKSINDQNGLPRIESMDKESIKELVEREGYCSTYSDLILKLVTPINHWSEYQQDHLHAKKQFSDENLKQLNLNDSTIKEFKKKQNAIGNICLLNPSVNNEKRASNLAEWIDKLQDYEKINLLIPNETNLEFLNFISFVRERESLIVNKLNEVLGLKEELRLPRYLTKSRFKLATECPTKLYYTGKPKEYKDTMQENAFLAMLAEGGYQVGALAKLRYPDGIEITDKTHAEAYAKTLEYLAQENVVLFEPAILVGDFFIRIDILVKKGNRFELIEVKAKSYDSLNPNIAGVRTTINSGMLPYVQDAAFQTWVLQQAFPKADITTFLMMPDKAHPSSIDGVNQMFKIGERSQVTLNIPQSLDTNLLAETLLAKVCVDQYVAEVLSTPLSYASGEGALSDLAKIWADAYKLDTKIKPVIGTHCGGCQFKATPQDKLKSGFHECWKEANHWQDQDFEGGTVLELWNFRKKQQLIDQGIYKISQMTRHDIGDFDDEADTTGLSRFQRQWLQVGGIPQDYDYGGYYFDKPLMQIAMSKWQFPYHMIDFETSTVALPFYAGMRPYEATAFQFSHHVMEADGSVRHAGEFLCTEPGVFPNYAFARALKTELQQDNGSVFMWSHHENTILSTIIRQLNEDPKAPLDAPELVGFLKTLVKGGERAMVDLCTIAEKAFFHPDTKGSNSIKQVLPAVLKESNHLKEIYTQPIYGAPNGIKSLNYLSENGFSWIETNPDGSVTEPYSKLKQYAKDLLPEGEISPDDGASVIAEGGAAATAYARLQFEDMNQETRQNINAALLRYCELDTLAMVMITQAWQAIA